SPRRSMAASPAAGRAARMPRAAGVARAIGPGGGGRGRRWPNPPLEARAGWRNADPSAPPSSVPHGAKLPHRLHRVGSPRPPRGPPRRPTTEPSGPRRVATVRAWEGMSDASKRPRRADPRLAAPPRPQPPLVRRSQIHGRDAPPSAERLTRHTPVGKRGRPPAAARALLL